MQVVPGNTTMEQHCYSTSAQAPPLSSPAAAVQQRKDPRIQPLPKHSSHSPGCLMTSAQHAPHLQPFTRLPDDIIPACTCMLPLHQESTPCSPHELISYTLIAYNTCMIDPLDISQPLAQSQCIKDTINTYLTQQSKTPLLLSQQGRTYRTWTPTYNMGARPKPLQD